MRSASLFLALVSQAIASDNFDYLYRLPGNLRPISYDLKLSIGSAMRTAFGEVSIEVYCLNSTAELVVHAHPSYLQIYIATVSRLLDNDSYASLREPTVDWRKQTLTFESFNRTTLMEEGNVYSLNFWFNATLGEDGWGLSWYDDKDRGIWLTTLFELSHARRLFPCFDEPRWKSSFKLELWLSGDFALDSYVALSNSPGTKVLLSEELTLWTFEPTPPLPTYLLTMAIGRFNSYCEIDAVLKEELCVWRFAHLDDWQKTAAYTIHLAAKFDWTMTNYLNMDSPSRLHFLIAPIRVSGMENFGLISIKTDLWPNRVDLEGSAIDPSLSNKLLVAYEYTVIHELAHQWFGNLVTPSWWSHVWLSESLTSLISGTDTDEDDQVTSDMSIDALVNEQWANGIPRLVYRKGTTVLRMLQSAIGRTIFRTVLQAFLQQFQYSTASTDDFIQVLRAVTQTHNLSFDACAFLNDWLYQGSYPIVSIYFDKEMSEFYLSQQPRTGDKATRWTIPIWSTCLHSNVTKLWWVSPQNGLSLKLTDVTVSNYTDSVVWNRNQSVYYQISNRY